MYLKPDGNSGEFIDLQVGYLKYHGENDLQQYFIRTTAMTKINCATEKEHIHSCEDIEGSINVEVVLGRRLLGDLLLFSKNKYNIHTFFTRNHYDCLRSNSTFDLYFLCHQFLQTFLL